MHLFLDFDGVLRRLDSEPSRFDADCRACFEEAVRPLPGIEIVISSTWRLAYSLAELRDHFSADVARRITGVTPESAVSLTHARYQEVRLYLKRRGIEDAPWLAVDDDPDHYPRSAPLLLVDPMRGFDADCARRLWRLYAQESGG